MPCFLLQICQSVCFVICLLMCLVGGTVAPADEIQLPGDKRFPIIGTIHCTFSPRGLAYSPDGKILAGCGRPRKEVFLWNAETCEEIAVLKGHAGFVNSLAFSPDGKMLASASDDWTVKLWDTKTHQLIATLTGHEGIVECVSFSPDGKRLATDGRDLMTKIWDLATRQTIGSFTRATLNQASRSYFFQAGKSVATIVDNTVVCWESDRVAPPFLVLQGPYEHAAERVSDKMARNDAILAVGLSPDGNLVAAGGLDRTLVCWTLPKGEEKFRVATGTVYSLDFSPNSKLLAINGPDDRVQVWDVVTGRLAATLRVTKDECRRLVFSPNGTTLATGTGDAVITLWDIRALTVQ